MSYYILAEQLTGELIQVAIEPVIQVKDQIVKMRGGDISDLNKYEYHPGSLSFIEKNQLGFITQNQFTQGLNLDDQFLIQALQIWQRPGCSLWKERRRY